MEYHYHMDLHLSVDSFLSNYWNFGVFQHRLSELEHFANKLEKGVFELGIFLKVTFVKLKSFTVTDYA